MESLHLAIMPAVPAHACEARSLLLGLVFVPYLS